jgi:hypothetical protein
LVLFLQKWRDHLILVKIDNLLARIGINSSVILYKRPLDLYIPIRFLWYTT